MDKNKPINTSLNRASEKGLNSALVPVRRSFWLFFYKGTYRTNAGTIVQTYQRTVFLKPYPWTQLSGEVSYIFCQSCHLARHFDKLKTKDSHSRSIDWRQESPHNGLFGEWKLILNKALDFTVDFKVVCIVLSRNSSQPKQCCISFFFLSTFLQTVWTGK